MKTSKRPVVAYATSIELDCPHCGETYPSPTGSLFWTLEEAQLHLEGQSVKCDSCDNEFKLVMPSRAAIQLPLVEGK